MRNQEQKQISNNAEPRRGAYESRSRRSAGKSSRAAQRAGEEGHRSGRQANNSVDRSSRPGPEDAGEAQAAATLIEGRNAVIEAFRSGRTADRLYVLDGCQDGAMNTIRREAAKAGVPIKYVSRERLDQMSETGAHQGVIAVMAAYAYAEVDDILAAARAKNEDPFVILLDGIEDPHNLGAILRTANVAGAHGVIIPKDRACGLTATVAKASAGAVNYTPVAKVTNLARTIDDLKEQGLWFVCADMDGTPMTQLKLTGPIGLVIGNEGEGVSRLVRQKCDMVAAIPQKGQISSLNASVAAGVLTYEIVRQREMM